MQVTKRNGFVVETIPLTDHGFVVTVFSQQDGLVKGIYRAPQGKHFSRSLLSPLTEISFELAGREQQNLKRITGESLVRQTVSTCSSYAGLCLLQHWAFLLAKSQPECARDERVYRLIDHCLSWASTHVPSPHDPAANCYFECWLLHLSGMFPRLTPASAGHVTLEHGTLRVDGQPLLVSEEPWEPEDVGMLQVIFKTKIEQFLAFALEWNGLARVSLALGDLWSRYLDRPLRARSMLTECFADKGLV